MPALLSGGNRTVRAFAGSLALQGGGAVLAFGMQASLASWLGPSDYGVLSTVLAIATFLGIVGTFGTNSAAVRYVPHFLAHDDPANATRFVAFALTTTALVGSVCGVAFAICALALHAKLSVSGAVLSAMTVVTTALLLTGTDLGRLAGRLGTAYAASLILRPALVIALVLIAVRLGRSADLTISLLFVLVSIAAAFLVQLRAVVGRFGRSAAKFVRLRRAWLRASPTYLAFTGLQLLLAQVDLLTVSGVLPSVSVGYYAAALRVSAVLTLPFVGVMAVTSPRIAAAASGPDSATAASQLARTAARWSALFTAPLAAAIVLWPDPVLHAFGASFEAAARFPVQMLCLGQAVLVAAGPGGLLLVYMDRRRIAIAGLAGSLLASVAACAAGALAGGVDGAAIASSASSALVALVMYLLAWRYLGIRASAFDGLMPFGRRANA